MAKNNDNNEKEKKKKNRNGTGSTRKRADGRWEMRITVIGRDGAPRSKSFYGTSETEVLKKCEQYQKELNGGIDPDVRYTVREWSEVWFEHHKKTISFATQDQYRSLLKTHIIPFLGNRQLADVMPFDIEEFQMHMHDEEYNAQTIRTCRGIVSKMFKLAQANRLVMNNPVSLAEHLRVPNDTPAPEEAEESPRSFTDEELKILMERLPTDKFGLGVRLMLCTGMRVQELLALEPKCISEDGSVIHVRQAVGRIKGTARIKGTKSKNGVRKIPVPESFQWIARELRKSDTKFIFEMRKKDTPCNPSTFGSKYKKMLEEIPEVRYLPPRRCRNTYISQMHSLEVDLGTLRSIVGHYDPKMTEHYLEVQERAHQSAVANFDTAFSLHDVLPKASNDNCKILKFPGPKKM